MTDQPSTAVTDKDAVLYRMVMPEHVCPYGLKARHLLPPARSRDALDPFYGRNPMGCILFARISLGD